MLLVGLLPPCSFPELDVEEEAGTGSRKILPTDLVLGSRFLTMKSIHHVFCFLLLRVALVINTEWTSEKKAFANYFPSQKSNEQGAMPSLKRKENKPPFSAQRKLMSTNSLPFFLGCLQTITRVACLFVFHSYQTFLQEGEKRNNQNGGRWCNWGPSRHLVKLTFMISIILYFSFLQDAASCFLRDLKKA